MYPLSAYKNVDVATTTFAPTTLVPVAAIILVLLVATDRYTEPAFVEPDPEGFPEAIKATLAGYFNALLDPNILRDATFLTLI